MRKRIFNAMLAASAMLTALTPGAYAQLSKSLEFIPDHVDFGMIREEEGKVSRKVKAVNISPESTSIVSARTSCGCSAVEFPEVPIAPGDTVEVTVTYDPTNRPGKFLKTARFYTGKERIGNSIKMNGTVIPSRKNLDKAYPERIGTFRLTTKILNTGEVSRKEARPLFVGVYNDSDKPVALSVETDGAPLEATLTPDTIEPFGIATLSLILKGRVIPEKARDFSYKTYLIDSAKGDTILSIPVGGIVKDN